MKLILKFLLVAVIWYLIFSFIRWDIDISNWSNWTRFWYVFFVMTTFGKSLD